MTSYNLTRGTPAKLLINARDGLEGGEGFVVASSGLYYVEICGVMDAAVLIQVKHD